MKGTFLCVILFIPLLVIAQDFPSDLLHEGKVVLINEDTLKGKIKYQGKIQGRASVRKIIDGVKEKK